MSPWSIALLTVVAFATATLSGIIGMGGGMLLLAMLFCFLDSSQAVPLHAAVQISSNGTRVWAFARHVHGSTVRRFALGAIPGAAIGTVVLWALGEPGDAEPYLKILIGTYILVVLFLPKPRGVPRPGRTADFTLLGLFAGAAGLVVGAVGPLIAPLFARRDFVKERLIATKAVCQMLLHVVKIPVFITLGRIQYAEFSILLVAMILVVIPGTILGKRILGRVSAETFVTLYRIALTVAGLKVLLIDGIWKAWQAF